MDIQELKQKVKAATFKDTDGFPYKFIPENTLRLSPNNVANYEIYEEQSNFYLKHNSILGSEDMLIEIMQENPLKLALSAKYSKRGFTTLTEG